MKDKLHPIFIDLCIGDKYIIRLVRTDEKIKGEYTYALKGTPKDIEALQADINDVFPQNRTQSYTTVLNALRYVRKD